MSDSDINAAQASRELQLTNAAFDAMREEYVEQAISAKDQGGVMAAIAAAKIVDDVRARLRAHLETLAIEQAVKDQN